jgi:hypothetical protein
MAVKRGCLVAEDVTSGNVWGTNVVVNISEPKTNVNSDEFRILHSKKICDLYRLRSIVGVITFWIM